MTELQANGPVPVREDPKSPILDSLESLKRWTVVLFLLLALLAMTTFIVRSLDLARVTESAAQNRQALCALRADVRDRVQRSAQFIRTHPEGIPGIPIQQIRQSMQAQRSTIKTLRVIDCSEINGKE